MNTEFTKAESVLFRATVDFLMQYEKLSIDEARQRAMYKILQKRSLVKKIKFKY